MSTIREGILIKRMPANQLAETSGGKREGKEREVVSLQKSALKGHLSLQLLKKMPLGDIYNMDIMKTVVTLQNDRGL